MSVDYNQVGSSCGRGTQAIIQTHKSVNERRTRTPRPTDMDPRTKGATMRPRTASTTWQPRPQARTKETQAETHVRDFGSPPTARHRQKHQKQLRKPPHRRDRPDHDISHRTSETANGFTLNLISMPVKSLSSSGVDFKQSLRLGASRDWRQLQSYTMGSALWRTPW